MRLASFVAFVVFEHAIVLLINVFLGLISKQPKWLSFIYKLQEYRKDVDIQIKKSEEVRAGVNKLQREEALEPKSSNSLVLQKITSR